MMTIRKISLFVLLTLLAVGVQAQQLGTGPAAEPGSPAAIPDANNFGTPLNYDWVSMEDFQPFSEGAGFSRNASDFYWTRSSTAGLPFLGGYLRLDSGAQVNGIRFFYRDTNVTLNPTFFVCVHTVNDSSGTVIGNDCSLNVTPTTDPNPGSVFLSIPAALNPYRRTTGGNEVRWILVASIPAGDGSIQFGGARAVWGRTVSPAPATASFTDVPTSHPFFQFIEALAASGITAGCTATQYCPDATVTRGQMAVFLSRGLGLHFSP